MLQYSEFNNEKNYQSPAPSINKHNKTIKKPVAELSALYNKIHKVEKPNEEESKIGDESENNLSDFKPLAPPAISSFVQQPKKNIEENIEENIKNYNDTYYATVPYNNTLTPDKTLNEELLNKLNYVINLLEEQKDERTNYITEELILYTFLGIFIIFIIDSFARASKYVR